MGGVRLHTREEGSEEKRGVGKKKTSASGIKINDQRTDARNKSDGVEMTLGYEVPSEVRETKLLLGG